MKRLKKIRKWCWKHKLLVVFLFLVTSFLVLFYFFILKDLPSPTRLNSASLPQSTQIFDRHDTLLYTIYNNKNQSFIPLSQIPKNIQNATIAIEDKDFYHHGAVDFRGISRAIIEDITHKSKVQGGSTLTQQLVKTSLLTTEQTWKRKIKEVVLSYVTEMLYSKNKILEMYLNQVPYGGTAYGIEAAARTYFGKDATKLDLAESALLAGLPEAPTINSPYGTHPEYAKSRQEEILHKMYEQKYITKAERDQATQEPFSYQKLTNVIKAPHFVWYVKDLLVRKYGEKMVEQGGLRVKTSLDLPLQDFAQDTVASEVAKVRAYHISNGGAVITNPATGEILAMVGSKGYFDTDIDGNVNVTIAHLQPGSSIKPINYATGLIKGYTAATTFIDEATCFPSPGSAPYCPQNYDLKFHGPVSMRTALGNSFNIPAVKMLKLNGVPAMIATASAMGISTFDRPDRYGLSLTLGGGEVTMLDMAEAYGVFANEGYRRELHPILQVTDARGKVLEHYDPPNSAIFGTKVIPSGVAFIISNILADNNARLQEFGPNSELKIPGFPVSVKTGTTNDFRDNWTIGYTPSFVTAVWVGNNDHTPMSGIVSGVTGAAPIWHTIMAHVLEGTKPQLPRQPNDVLQKIVCSTSGLLPNNGCPTRLEYFIRGTEPKMAEASKEKVFIDTNTHDLAKEGQTQNVTQEDHIIISDGTHARYCVDCPHPSPSPSPTPGH